MQKALGQENIDDLLKLSERYKKSESRSTNNGSTKTGAKYISAEIEIDRNRNGSTRVVEETRREVQETNPRNSAPVVIPASPPSSLEVVDRTVIRDVSPARSYTTSGHSSHHHHHHHHHRHNDGALYVEIKDRPAREVSEPVPVGPLALAERRRSRSDREIREEIRALEAELARHPGSGTTEIVRAERLPDGHLVVYDEHIERVETPPRGVRIERDRKGRMSISVPRRY